jgi:hypothetical protein
MLGLPIGFAAPVVLAGLLALPLIWLLLRLTPPKPIQEIFPPLRVLEELRQPDETPQRSPWWLTALRMLLAALAIIALAGPMLNPQNNLSAEGEGQLVLIIDDGWASQKTIADQLAAARSILESASSESRLVRLHLLSNGARVESVDAPDVLLERIAAIAPKPARFEYMPGIETLIDELAEPAEIMVLSSGITAPDWPEAAATLIADGHSLRVLTSSAPRHAAIAGVENGDTTFDVTVSTIGAFETNTLTAFDDKGRTLGTAQFSDAETTEDDQLRLAFDMPLELRNDIERLVISDENTAAATYLVDGGAKRRRVAMLSGVANELAQPLLEPMHYISRALASTAEVKLAQEANLVSEIERLLDERPSIFVLADVGTLPEAATEQLSAFVERGGTLLRFAGPRLAAGDFQDPLIPVLLREGERALGGSLSWAEPQPIAPFESGSPFVGIQIAQDITVNRQVLAEPDSDLPGKTWASLADGTPLVTATVFGRGEIVLFHTTADATWTNLPLSGTFVAMLNRVVERSRNLESGPSEVTEDVILPPLKTVQANGIFGPPVEGTRPLALTVGVLPSPSADNPPGQYGTQEGVVALNLFETTRDGDVSLTEMSIPDQIDATLTIYPEQTVRDLSVWFFVLAFALLALDTLIMIFLNGGLRRKTSRAVTAALLVGLTGALIATMSTPIYAQEETDDASFEKTLPAAFEVRIGYVLTGDRRTDDLSRTGISGMSRFVASRTSLEPGEPIGLDLEVDELAFFPLIYWPISTGSDLPSPGALARIDAYMKNGGTVLFDTRNGLSQSLRRPGSQSPSEERLAEILSDLDIPPLEPVPVDHVLTKSFYLLDSFPGRFDDSPLWVEALPVPVEGAPRRPARAGDGVSSILISGNDLAGAWALDEAGRPLLPTSGSDPRQRLMAFRTGVNIMMYAMTGNYKADQIHIPDLLERLGQ